ARYGASGSFRGGPGSVCEARTRAGGGAQGARDLPGCSPFSLAGALRWINVSDARRESRWRLDRRPSSRMYRRRAKESPSVSAHIEGDRGQAVEGSKNEAGAEQIDESARSRHL